MYNTGANFTSRMSLIFLTFIIVSIISMLIIKYYFIKVMDTTNQDTITNENYKKAIWYYYTVCSVMMISVGIIYLLLLGGIMYKIKHGIRGSISLFDKVRGLSYIGSLNNIKLIRQQSNKYITNLASKPKSHRRIRTMLEE